MSQRMRILEDSLAGADTTVLTTAPTQLWQKIRQHPGLSRATLLMAPFESYALRGRLPEGIQKQDPAAQQFASEFSAELRSFEDLNDLLKGLIVMFRGEFHDGVDTLGAKSYLGGARQPDSLIDQLGTSTEAQETLDVRRILFRPQINPETGAVEIDPQTMQPVVEKIPNFDAVVAILQRVIREVKQHASYRLGIVELEGERYESAESWLRVRTIEAYPECRWIRHAEYCLARVHEEWGQVEQDPERRLQAIKWYQSDRPGPMAHGCCLRARRLQAESAKK